MLKIDNINVEFTDDFLDEVANSALENGTGARGLRNFIENAMEEVMFDAPDMKDNTNIKITSNYIYTKEFKKEA